MAKKLAIKALLRGVGSMDFIDMLLIMEDPDEFSDESNTAPPPPATSLEPSTSNSGSSWSSSMSRTISPIPQILCK